MGYPVISNGLQVGGGGYPEDSIAGKYYDKLQAIKATLKSVNKELAPHTINEFEYKIRELLGEFKK